MSSDMLEQARRHEPDVDRPRIPTRFIGDRAIAKAMLKTLPFGTKFQQECVAAHLFSGARTLGKQVRWTSDEQSRVVDPPMVFRTRAQASTDGFFRGDVCMRRADRVSAQHASHRASGDRAMRLLDIGQRDDRRSGLTSGSCSLHGSPAMSDDYRLRPARDAREWETFFGRIAHPHLMQTHAYGEAKQRAQRWHVARYVFERVDEPVAICQVLEKRVGGLRFGARVNRGPLFLDEPAADAVKEGVLRLLRTRWKIFCGGPLLIAPALDMSPQHRALLARLGFRDRGKYCHGSALFDLRPDEESMRKRLAPNWRNHLKQAERSGLSLQVSSRPESVGWMLDRHTENMRAKNFAGPSTALLQSLYEANPADFLVLRAVFDGEPLAGMILARCGRKAEYYIGWYGAAGRKFNCGNFLCWNAALEMKKAGCEWLDLGGCGDGDGFGNFKKGMRGIEYRLVGEWVGF
jgi:hypothetical protein